MRRPYSRPRRSLREHLYAFMIGRNGSDELTRAILILYLALFIVNLFVRSWIVNIVAYAIIVYSLFRMLSRNLLARRRENAAYLRLQNSVTSFFRLQRNKWRDRKTHVYRRCKTCKSTLRLPRQKGKHTVKCPCCGQRFSVKI